MPRTTHLLASWATDMLEAGCDEAGRGCLAGPVFAAAVILPADFNCTGLNDSKMLSRVQREHLRRYIEENALSWAVASVDNTTIDEINILNASYLAMHKAVNMLEVSPQILLIDGNHFKPFPGIPHECFVKGDARFMSIAAASVLAKTHRDDFMLQLHATYPHYRWDRNKGYPTAYHINALRLHGPSRWHRSSFKVRDQLKFEF